ncbi:hypothetical protein ACFLWS_05530 [Chloroflexota bacterium]
MEERNKLEKERDVLSREYFVELLPKSMDIDKRVSGLVLKESGNEASDIIGKIILTEEFLKEYNKLEKERERVDAKRREIWERILAINQKLM